MAQNQPLPSSAQQANSLTGVRIALVASGGAELTRMARQLARAGARVEQFPPERAWTIPRGWMDVVIFRVDRPGEPTATPSPMPSTADLMGSLAERERVIGLLDDLTSAPPAGLRDFVLAPFLPEEVISRIQRVIEEPRPIEKLTAGNIELDVASRTVTVGRQVVPLTFHEFRLLKAIMAANGAVLGRSALSSEVFDQQKSASFRRVDILVSRLRNKIGHARGVRIETKRKEGYQLVAAQHS